MKFTQIADPTPLPYRERFSKEELARIRKGHVPHDMDDKWFIRFEHPYLNFHRSWTGQGVYRVELAEDPQGAVVASASCAAEILAGSNPEDQAGIVEFLIGSFLLGRGVPFPNPEDEAAEHPGLYQHAVSGTGLSEKRTRPKRSWWKFWR